MNRTVLRALILALLLGVGGLAQAQDEAASGEAAAEDGAGKNATEFVAAPPEAEKISGLSLMVAAYIAVWIVIVGYILFLLTRQRRLYGELHDIRSRLEAIDAQLAEGGGGEEGT